ncbi:MAG: sensor histidine kinase, partial [bacterium]
NNLQIICSLLSLQSRYIDDKRYLQFFKETQNRINSMALMHENLYQSKDLANVYLNDYVNDLLKHLFHFHGIIPGNIALNTSVENISIDIDTAVPFGLIINELVSNSLKHAFPANIENPRAGRKDEIKIDLQSVEDQIILTVSDNGVGFPENLDFRNTESLGLQLVYILTEQLGGTITLDRRGGITFTIRFIQPKFVKNKESKRKKVVK